MVAFTQAEREQAFMEKVVVVETGCWVWQGGRGGYENSYGTFFNGERTERAHRWAYRTWVGDIPPGMTLDHLCRVRLCVNPRHLEPVTKRVNTLRSPNAVSAVNARKTHCPQGHPLSGRNLYRDPANRRVCRACARDRYRRWYQKGAATQTNP